MGGAGPSSESPSQIKHPSLENWSNQPQIVVSHRRIRTRTSSRRFSVSNLKSIIQRLTPRRTSRVILTKQIKQSAKVIIFIKKYN